MVVALEGLDGSGKRTQAIQLKARVGARRGQGRDPLLSPLRGDGVWREDRRLLERWIRAIEGRYTLSSGTSLCGGSSRESALDSRPPSRAEHCSSSIAIRLRTLAYQGARLEGGEREAFLDLARKDRAPGSIASPVPDLQIFLSVPPEISMRRVSEKGERNYTSRLRDLHEENAAYLGRCHEVYEFLIETELPSRWKSIECLRADGEMRSIDDIAEEIWVAINDWPNQSLRT